MPKPLSFDLRERAVSRVLAGESVRSVAAVLQVSVSSVVKWSSAIVRREALLPVGLPVGLVRRCLHPIVPFCSSGSAAANTSRCAVFRPSSQGAGPRSTTGRSGTSSTPKG